MVDLVGFLAEIEHIPPDEVVDGNATRNDRRRQARKDIFDVCLRCWIDVRHLRSGLRARRIEAYGAPEGAGQLGRRGHFSAREVAIRGYAAELLREKEKGLVLFGVVEAGDKHGAAE